MNAAFLSGRLVAASGRSPGGLGDAPLAKRTGKKGRRNARARGNAREPGIAQAVNAFVAGRAACTGVEFPQHLGFTPNCRFSSDGARLEIDGAVVAERPRGIGSKQIKVCLDPQGALEAMRPGGGMMATTKADADYMKRAWRDRMLAANVLLGALRAGVRASEAKDFMEGYLRQYRVQESRWRLGGAAGSGVVASGCFLVEVTEQAREKAVVGMITSEADRLWRERLEQYGFPQKAARTPRARKLSRAELRALAKRARLALDSGDAAMLKDAAARLKDAVLTNRSTYFKD